MYLFFLIYVNILAGDFMFKNKTLLITGAYRGIGKEIVQSFASLGVNIILTFHRRVNETFDFADEIKEKYHVNVECHYLDLSSERSVKYLYEAISEKYEKIDYLINNAALSLDSYIYDKCGEEFMSVLEVNAVGTFLMMRYFDKIVNGFIFNISSTDGIDTGSAYSVDYNASKAAINSITKTFSLVSSNKIICICPNWVDVESTREIDKEYLEKELKRIKQDKLINPKTISKVIIDSIKNNIETGSIIRIDGDKDVRRVS